MRILAPFTIAVAVTVFGCGGADDERRPDSGADAVDDSTPIDMGDDADGSPDATPSDVDVADVDADETDPDAETDAAADAPADARGHDADTAELDASDTDSIDADTSDTPDLVHGDAADAGVALRGACASDDDCGGSPCLRIHEEEGGYTTCFTRMPPIEECSGALADPACCSSADCSETGECFAGPLFYCGGVAPVPTATCHEPQCVADVDCADRDGGLCVPAGAFGEPVARCAYAACRLHADCTAGPGGECSPFFDACTSRFTTFSCTYDDSPCRTNADCGADVCVAISDHATACVPFMPPP